MRWFALGVDYEMAGKDLIDSASSCRRICARSAARRRKASTTSSSSTSKGQKISKSKGNGLTIDEWLTYAAPESLALFMYRKPRAAKRLHFDVIPRAVDDYYSFVVAPSTKCCSARPRGHGLGRSLRCMGLRRRAS
jgi:lysyl-tRNA synthetase class 1